jgi:hypothetical protein
MCPFSYLLADPHGAMLGKRRGTKIEWEERKINQGKIRVAPGEEEIHLLSFFPLWLCLDLDSNLVQIMKSKLQPFCSVHAVFVQAVFRGP